MRTLVIAPDFPRRRAGQTRGPAPAARSSRRMLRRALAAVLALLVPAIASPGAAQAAPALPPLPAVSADTLRDNLAAIYADYYNLDPQAVERLMRAGIPDDDVSGICLVSTVGPSPSSILALLRIQKVPWSEVFVRHRIRAHALLPRGLRRQPGGRYAAAVARIVADPEGPARLSDEQVRDLVQLKLAVEYFGADPTAVMQWRNAGIPNARILLSYYYAGGQRLTGRKIQVGGSWPSAAKAP